MRRLVAHDLPAQRLAEALMAEAHAEDRDLAVQLRDRLAGDPGIFRRAGAGRDDHTVVVGQLPDAYFVVAKHSRLDPELSENGRQLGDILFDLFEAFPASAPLLDRLRAGARRASRPTWEEGWTREARPILLPE